MGASMHHTFQNLSILLVFDDTDEQRRLVDQKRHTRRIRFVV
jgi:hypothetical protein